ncbi:receptor-type tyrosine-protein phosphatase H [Sceloporus undulatus]|uniref:receptor-type tyrosine-protein phosphatase H n=1 Tax=Sceloporus undulatus TaxID=8520 RepID=UPI001C4B2BF5|nr:receptor-type tyrosine-protein phosphatase H [Sceloporus undulatus]
MWETPVFYNLPFLCQVLLLLLLPGQQGKMKSTTITTPPPTTTPDCCRKPVKENIVVALCSVVIDANATQVKRRWDTRAQDLGCGNTTDLCHDDQSNVSVVTVFPPLPNCTIFMCTEPSAIKKLTFGTQTNSSIILHWQTTLDCCHMATSSSHTIVVDGTWRNGTTHISGLLPGQDYDMTVYRTLDERCSQGYPINMTTMPSPVPEVMILSQTVDSLEIGWTQPEDPHVANYSYRICLSNCTTPSQNPHIVKDLEAGVTYRVVVYAVTKNNINSTGKAINATTVPNSPRKIHVKRCSNNSFSISWNASKDKNAELYKYCLSWFPENNPDLLREKCGVTGSSYTIDQLQPGLLYSVNVSSIIHDLKSKEMTERFLTLFLLISFFQPPAPPTHFSIKMINQTVAEFTWETPSSPFSSYQLKWKSWANSKENQTSLQNSSTDAVLSGLTPNTNYTFTLLSLTKGENLTACSTEVQQHGATKPEQITDMKCLAVPGGQELKLSWKCPTHEVSKLVILVSNQTWKTWWTCKESTVVGHLQPARRYQIQVRTYWYDHYVMSDLKECSTDSTGIIVGSLVAVLLLLVILSLLLLYFRRWRKCSNGLEKPKPDVGLPEVLASVPVAAFPCYCSEHLSNSAFGFAKEYQQLQDIGTGQSQSVAERPENQAKNRYSNVLPYDHARVPLIPKPGDPNSDYINASYMPGFKREKEFIAAQGPLRETLYDFWRMIWEQRSTTLIMLTNCIENGRVKCERYWPLDYTPCTYEDISVSVVTETILPDWTVRDFSIKRMNESEVRLAKHYHYTSWPDHGVPHTTNAVLHFRDLVRGHMEEHEGSGPALVHCSAGVGRTGTFIALDSMLRQAQEEGQMGVFSFVQRLRMNRPLMIQTESQYIFLHQCLLEGIKPAVKNGTEKMEYTAVYENTLALQEYEVSRV